MPARPDAHRLITQFRRFFHGSSLAYRRQPAGLVISAAGLVILARGSAHGGYGVIALALAVFGLGLGLLACCAACCLIFLPAKHAAAE